MTSGLSIILVKNCLCKVVVFLAYFVIYNQYAHQNFILENYSSLFLYLLNENYFSDVLHNLFCG